MVPRWVTQTKKRKVGKTGSQRNIGLEQRWGASDLAGEASMTSAVLTGENMTRALLIPLGH